MYIDAEGGGIPVHKVAEPEKIDFVVIDLFAGAGGTSSGFHMAELNGKRVALVAAAVNHDWKAIKSHWQNHPEVFHFEEDIRTLNLSGLIEIVAKYREMYPNAKIILWASLECTNFSKAKGGLSRDPDSRTLAIHLPRYIRAINPDYVQIENVVEFMAWGPLRIKAKKTHKENKKTGTYAYTELKTGIDKATGEECYWWTPISKLNGTDFRRWKESICDMGYYDEWKRMNAADYGGYTSRDRLFGCFAKPGLPIVFPETTHAKKASKEQSLSLFSEQQPKKRWKAVKDVLDFKDEGESIFNRLRPIKHAKHAKDLLRKGKKVRTVYALPSIRKDFVEPFVSTTETIAQFDIEIEKYHTEHGRLDFYYYENLADKSLERTYAGLIKFVAGMSKKSFLLNYNSAAKDGSQKQGARSMDEPCPTIPTQNRLYACFIQQRNGGNPDGRVISLEGPARSLTATAGNQDLVQPQFLTKYYSGDPDNKISSTEEPIGVLRTKDGHSLNTVNFLLNYHGASDALSIDTPAPPLLTRDKLALQHIDRVKGFIAKYYGTGGQLNSFDEACPSVTARENLSKMQLLWLERDFSNGSQHSSIENPAGSVMPVPKMKLMKAVPFIQNQAFGNVGSSIEEPAPVITANRKHHYIVNPSYYGHASGVDNPCPVIIARQDKAPLYLMGIDYADTYIPIYDDDSEVMMDIKVFMALYGIADIKMRMLKVSELLKIQGFPDDYKLFGNQSDQKKFIGNSVHPFVPKAWAERMAIELRKVTSLN